MSSTQTPQADERAATLKRLLGEFEVTCCIAGFNQAAPSALEMERAKLHEAIDQLAVLTPPKQVPAEQASAEALPVVAYDVPRSRGSSHLVYAPWFDKFGHKLPDGSIPLADHATATARIEELAQQLAAAALPQPPQGAEGGALTKLAKFGALMLRAHRGTQSCEVGDIGGDTAQEAAIECGLLEQRIVTTPCGESCVCADIGFPAECYFVPDDIKACRAALSTPGAAKT